MRWPVASLGELCQINIGRTPSRSVPAYWEGGSHPWLSISDMGRAKEISKTKEGITETAINDCNMRLVQPGTVLFSFKLSIGKLGIAAVPLFTNEAIASLLILDRDCLCAEYLFHALQEASGRVVGDRAAMGITLNKASLAQIDIPLPPLEEQRRIAVILDKASRIQSAAAEQAARATADLYRSILMDELSKMDADNVQLGDILEIARGGSPRPIQAFLTDDPSGINWVMIGDTVVGDKYITKTAKKIKLEGLSKTRIVAEGDLLLSNSMSFGRPYIMKTNGAIHDGWLLLRDSAQRSNPDYLYHVLGSPICYSQFLRAAAGATVKNLNTSIVSSVEIPLPTLDKQLEIAARLDAVEDKLGNRFSSLSNKAKELKACLLGAFFGEG